MLTPCSWPVVYAGCDPAAPDAEPEVWADLPPETRAVAEDMATTYLWNLTGRVYGLCDVVVRPCRRDCYSGSTWAGTTPQWSPALIDGRWFNITCGSCGPRGCTCGDTPHDLRLPGPIASIGTITIDGDELPSGSYRVDNHSILVRTDGGSWPVCQDMSADPTQPDTFVIAYERGIEVPTGGQVAAGELAVEFAKAMCDDSSCRLPRRVQSITRQGVSMAVLDAFEDIEKGHTGIWLIDSWVASVTAQREGGRVYSPDLMPRRTHTRSTTWRG